MDFAQKAVIFHSSVLIFSGLFGLILYIFLNSINSILANLRTPFSVPVFNSWCKGTTVPILPSGVILDKRT